MLDSTRRQFLQLLGAAGVGALLPSNPTTEQVRALFAADPLSEQGKPNLVCAPAFILQQRYDKHLRALVRRISTLAGRDQYGIETFLIRRDVEFFGNIKDLDEYTTDMLIHHMNQNFEKLGFPLLDKDQMIWRGPKDSLLEILRA